MAEDHEQPELLRLWVDFNRSIWPPDVWTWVWVNHSILPVEVQASLHEGRLVLLEETTSIVIDGERCFVWPYDPPMEESIEVEAILHFVADHGAWYAEPDWQTVRYVTYRSNQVKSNRLAED